MSDNHAEDEVAINAILSEMYQAWAANDADGFVRHYTDDATAIMPGSLRGSRQAIRDSMAAGFDGPLKDSSTFDRQLSLRFVGADTAIAVSEGGILFAGETSVPEARKIHATWVFEMRDSRWMVAAYHNSPSNRLSMPDPVSSAADGDLRPGGRRSMLAFGAETMHHGRPGSSGLLCGRRAPGGTFSDGDP